MMDLHRKKNKRSFGIIGLGRFGSALALELAKRGEDILVIDWQENNVQKFREYTENAYIIESMEKKALEQTGIQNCDVAIVCLGEKMDTSILTTLYLNSLGIPKVIAKANTTEHGEILEKLGAEVVYPERDMAVRIARRLESSNVITYLELSEKVDISLVKLPSCYVGKRVGETDIRRKYKLNIIAIERKEEFLSDIIPECVFEKDDAIVVIGSRNNLEQFENV